MQETTGQLTAEQGEQVGTVIGGGCGVILGVVIVVAVAITLARRRREAAPVMVAPCPKCGESSAFAVGYTWWGGLLGPKLLNHVACTACGTTFNGKTGRSNSVGIAIYVATTGTLIAIFLFVAFLIAFY